MIGILVSDTAFSESNLRVFDLLNDNSKTLVDAVLLYMNLSSQMMVADFPIMNITEIHSFYGGKLIATCLDTADLLQKAAIGARKMFYLWDLSFILKPYDFQSMYKLLSGLELVVRSEPHRKIIKNLFNLDATIVPYLNLET